LPSSAALSVVRFRACPPPAGTTKTSKLLSTPVLSTFAAKAISAPSGEMS
jgi:hypothetical protein